MQAMMEEQFGGYYGSSEDNNGPAITFIASVSDEQIQAATKAAHEAAVKKVQSLVTATGLKLGGLRSVSSHSDSEYAARAMYYGGRYTESQILNSLNSDDENIISSQNADELVRPIVVSVSYALAE